MYTAKIKSKVVEGSRVKITVDFLKDDVVIATEYITTDSKEEYLRWVSLKKKSLEARDIMESELVADTVIDEPVIEPVVKTNYQKYWEGVAKYERMSRLNSLGLLPASELPVMDTLKGKIVTEYNSNFLN